MENISNQVSYLKGLMDGLNFDENSNEGKVFKAIANVLEEIDFAMDDLYDYQDEIAEQVDMIDGDLAAVEEEILDCEDCDDCCDCDDDEYYEIECPNCKEIICVDEETICSGDDIICPNCDEEIELDFDCDCDDCDCDCEE